MNESQFKKLLMDKNPTSWFLSVLENPQNTKNPYAKSIKLLTNNFQIYKIGDLIDYWKSVDYSIVSSKLNEQNWMYVYCIRYGFRKNLLEKDINIYFNGPKKTPEEAKQHLLNLTPMSSEDISHFLSNSPIVAQNGKVINGFHRTCAMIGRLIDDKKYIRVC